jgi:hypothetical protein
MLRRALPVVLLAVLLSCSDDDEGPTGPPGLDFPALPNSLRAAYCIRGNVTVGDTPSGIISNADCNDLLAYVEAYLVKVDAARSVTFSVLSDFDSQLWLYRITSFDSQNLNISLVAEDDNSGGVLDAELTADLNPTLDYVIVVSGKDHLDQGNYALEIRDAAAPATLR